MFWLLLFIVIKIWLLAVLVLRVMVFLGSLFWVWCFGINFKLWLKVLWIKWVRGVCNWFKMVILIRVFFFLMINCIGFLWRLFSFFNGWVKDWVRFWKGIRWDWVNLLFNWWRDWFIWIRVFCKFCFIKFMFFWIFCICIISFWNFCRMLWIVV